MTGGAAVALVASPFRLLRETIASLTWTEFTTRDREPLIAGRRAGSGPPVLLLHGGPGLGFDYLRDPLPSTAQQRLPAAYLSAKRSAAR